MKLITFAYLITVQDSVKCLADVTDHQTNSLLPPAASHHRIYDMNEVTGRRH